MLELEPVIGLEVHAQVLTCSKMFCGCDAKYAGAPPNTHVCAVCSGMPGALPVANRRAVQGAILASLALHCTVGERSKFDRKNYSYPDLPKGYQITQFDMPIGHDGWLSFDVGGHTQRCSIVRVHLEEDTGKSIHTRAEGSESSLIDYNRSGIPLMEIVSAPELVSPESAREYFSTLRRILLYLRVCDGNLQEGSMRADVNISLRRPGGAMGTKVEIKNLNSFRAVERALAHEIARQRSVLEDGGHLTQETRGWSEKDELTVPQRTKEYAHDYRYFPEPDLPPLLFTPEYIDGIRGMLPEMPVQRRARFEHDHGLSPASAALLTEERALADFFEASVQAAGEVPPATVANWVTGEVLRLRADSGRPLAESELSPAAFGRLLAMVHRGAISVIAAKDVLAILFSSGGDPDSIAVRLNLWQISDETELDGLVEDVLAANQQLVALYREGKTNVLQALVGKVRQVSRGRADPVRTAGLLRRHLDLD